MKVYNILQRFMLLLAFVCSSAAWAGNNTLSVTKDLKCRMGSIATIPIELTNEDEIVAAQFNIKLPYTLQGTATLNATRNVNGHTISIRNLGNNSYTVVIVNMANKAIAGNSGTIAYLPIYINTEAQPGEVKDITLSNVVLTNRKGDNITSGDSNGKLTIVKSPSPDLVPSNLTFANNSKNCMPEGSITLNWYVDNIGDSIASQGWSEKLYLVDKATEKSIYIGSTNCYSQLVKGGRISRTATVVLPAALGIDGEAYAKVVIIGNSGLGEFVVDQANNTLQSEQTTNIGKKLYFETSSVNIAEDNTNALRLRIVRSGDWSTDEEFTLNTLNTDLITVPESVVIPQGQSGAYFYVYAKNNNIVNKDDYDIITASSDEYESASITVNVEDDEFYSMELEFDKTTITEGESVNVTVNLAKKSTEDQVVSISTDMPKRFSFPSTITIPAGKLSQTFTIKAKDDDVADVTQLPAFHFVANHYNKSTAHIVLEDNDIPDIIMELKPDAVNENAGSNAIIAKVKRVSSINSNINIVISDNSNGGLYYSQKNISLNSGTREATFYITPVDNQLVDGDREYTLTASVYISSCSCKVSGELKGVAKAKVTVIDNDGPSLSIKASSGLTEGMGNGAEITISRNDSPINDLTVKLSSDDDRIEFSENPIVIPTGSTSKVVTVKAKANSTTGDTGVAVITATTPNYAAGKGWIQIVDETLPDAVITKFEVSNNAPYAGEEVTISYTVENQGVADIPAGKGRLYTLLGSNYVDTLVINSKAVAPGSSVKGMYTITMPEEVKTTTLMGEVNKSYTFNEMLYTNNQSNSVPITIQSPFEIDEVSVEKAIYSSQETVKITGKLSGHAIANQSVEVYVINEGRRETFTTTSAEDGTFSTRYTPTISQIGHFSIGACYPGRDIRDEMTKFDIIGLRRKSGTSITHEITIGTPVNASVSIYNPSAITLSSIKAEIVGDAPDDVKVTFGTIKQINGGDVQTLSYKIEGVTQHTDLKWHVLQVKISSAEGASFVMPISYYNYVANGSLKLSISSIKTTMIKGDSRDYNFTITNIGKGETGKMTIDLPKGQTWMKTVTPISMPSIANGESANVILRFTPNDNMDLNIPYTGTIAVNAEHANGMSIPYRVEMVSGKNGTLTVEVCDEFTYYDETKPRVKGAQVVVRHPSTNALITQGVTNDDGYFTAELPEGYYALAVSADDHDSYTGNVLVDPGTENRQVVNLPYQAVKISWDVVETTVEDVYDIKTTVTYETRVPKPVVEFILPDSVPTREISERGSAMIYAVVTNKGLIAAQNVSLSFEDLHGCEFEYLVENGFTLAPGESKVLPVRICAIVDEEEAKERARNFYNSRHRIPSPGFNQCILGAFLNYFFQCGGMDEQSIERKAMALQDMANCDNGGWGWEFSTSTSSSGSSGGGPSSHETSSSGSSSSHQTATLPVTDCDPCVQAMHACAIKNAACVYDNKPATLKHPNDLGEAFGVGEAVATDVKNVKNKFTRDPCTDCKDYGACAGRGAGGASGAAHSRMRNAKVADNDETNETSLNTIANAVETGKYSVESDSYSSLSVTTRELLRSMKMLYDYSTAGYRLYYHLAGGDDGLFGMTSSEQDKFLEGAALWDKGEIDNDTFCENYRPEEVSETSMRKFINNINEYLNTGSFITQDSIDYYNAFIDIIDKEMFERGYADAWDYFVEYKEKFEDMIKLPKSGVCATIQLQISQTMTMTRQAFLGTLTVFNGHEAEAMTDMKLDLVVTNPDGDVATSHEFQINPTSLDGFEGELDFESGWRLGANSTGVATVTFIPTKYAAPEEPVEYSFGGSLTYTNPYTGAKVTRELYPVKLTVKPAPELDLTYFMQRDVMGDNALTEDVIEPSIPGEFALLINNKGNGEATNVNILTNQPEIVPESNTKGLLVDFEILSSTVNGKDKTLALGGSVASDFGNIPAKSQSYAQWELKCDLMGHFLDYDVSATHVTSYGNPDLSLLDQVTIHELIHTIEVPSKDGQSNLVGWLVNDIEDYKDIPDMLYFSDATVSEVSAFDEELADVTKLETTRYKLVIHPEKSGWIYGNIVDPVTGRSEVVSITRQSDGKVISGKNFWQTEWTLRDGVDPLKDYRLHFVDTLSTAAEEIYIIEFKPLPDVQLAVTSITGPDEEKQIQFDQVNTIKVQFNKDIYADTFTAEDLSMRCQGKDVDLSTVRISTDDNRNFTLSMGNTTQDDGYYVLKVATNNITDQENYFGREDAKIDWIFYLDGFVRITAQISPLNSGEVTITSLASADQNNAKSRRLEGNNTITGNGSLSVPYNTETLLTAVPKDGYKFIGWYVGEECVSTSSTYTSYYLDHTNVEARFVQNNIKLSVHYNEKGGVVNGGGSGTYGYGEELTLRALPSDNYVFTGWVENHEVVTKDEFLNITMDEDKDVTAEFVLEGGKVGDVNVDKFITVSDIVALTNLLLDRDVNGASIVYADANYDNRLTVSDATAITNMIKGESSAKRNYYYIPAKAQASYSDLCVCDFNVDAGGNTTESIGFEGLVKYSCFQFDIDVPQGLRITDVTSADAADSHVIDWDVLNSGSIRVIGYSFDNVLLKNGPLVNITVAADTDIVNGSYPMTFTNVILGRQDASSSYMENRTANILVSGGATGVDNHPANDSKDVYLYDLQGRQRKVGSNLSKGIYISNGNKIFIK